MKRRKIIGSLEKTRSSTARRFKRTADTDEGNKNSPWTWVRAFLRGCGSNDRRSQERQSHRGSLIFVGCASRSPAAYERGINYPGVSVWSLLRSLSASLPFSLVYTLYLPLNVRPSHSACSGNHSPLSFVHPSPSLAPLPPPECL